MALTPDELKAIEDALVAQVDDVQRLVPKASTLAETLGHITRRLLARMQSALRDRYGELSTPLPEELLELLTTGTLGELLGLAYRHLRENEKAWADQWKADFERDLANLAAGVDHIAEPARRRRKTVAVSSSPRRLTDASLDRMYPR